MVDLNHKCEMLSDEEHMPLFKNPLVKFNEKKRDNPNKNKEHHCAYADRNLKGC